MAARSGGAARFGGDLAGLSSRRFLLDSPGGVNVPQREKSTCRPCERRDNRNYVMELRTLIGDIYSMAPMTAPTREQITTFIRGISLRQVRLLSGVILFA